MTTQYPCCRILTKALFLVFLQPCGHAYACEPTSGGNRTVKASSVAIYALSRGLGVPDQTRKHVEEIEAQFKALDKGANNVVITKDVIVIL